MDPVTATAPWWAPPLIQGGAAFATGALTSAFNVFQAKESRKWQGDMSNTAHQREVEDLRKAGLNPILSARHGGASTPPGATAQAGDFSGVHSALQTATLAGQLKLQEAQAMDLTSAAGLKQAQTYDTFFTQLERLRLLKAQWRETLQRADKTDLEKLNLRQELKNLEIMESRLLSEAAHSAFDLSRARRERDFYEGHGGAVAPWIQHIMKGLPIKGR